MAASHSPGFPAEGSWNKALRVGDPAGIAIVRVRHRAREPYGEEALRRAEVHQLRLVFRPGG